MKERGGGEDVCGSVANKVAQTLATWLCTLLDYDYNLGDALEYYLLGPTKLKLTLNG